MTIFQKKTKTYGLKKNKSNNFVGRIICWANKYSDNDFCNYGKPTLNI